MKIGIIGCGKVGSTLGLYLNDNHEVIALDVNPTRFCLFKLTDSYEDLKDVDVVFIAVPTPFNEKINNLDISLVEEVISKFLKMNKKAYIYIKSTMPFGGTSEIINKTKYPYIFYTPEFIREIDTSYSIKKNGIPRIIFGRKEANIAAKNTYFELFPRVKQKLEMKLEEAEVVKLFSNAYLAYRINFFNQVNEFAKSLDLDSEHIIKGISLDPRIGDYYNKPSIGFAGKCLPKDVRAIGELCKVMTGDVMYGIYKSNRERIDFFYNQIMEEINKFDEPVIGFNWPVMSDTPYQEIIERLINDKHPKTIRMYGVFDIEKITVDGVEHYRDYDDFADGLDILIDVGSGKITKLKKQNI